MKATWRSLKKPHAGLWLLALVLAGGCEGAGPYRAVLNDRTAALEDLEKVLSTVTDQASMKAARGQILEHYQAYENIVKRAQKLSPPSEDVRHDVQMEAEKMMAALRNVQAQVRRVLALPGGKEFLDSFDSMSDFFGVQVR